MSNLPRIAWGITGAGHFLEQCVEMILAHGQVDVFISAAGLEVLKMYGLYDRLHKGGHTLFFDEGAASFPAVRVYGGRYDLVVIAPATSNSVAKMNAGICDGLVTNLFATAGKCRVPVIVLPCDVSGEVTSTTHHGKEVKIHVRPVDAQNTEALAGFEGVQVVHNPEELKEFVLDWQPKKTGV